MGHLNTIAKQSFPRWDILSVLISEFTLGKTVPLQYILSHNCS